MSFSGSSMDLVLAEDWTVSRPSFMTPGFAAQRPMSILDFSLQDGPINVMSLDNMMGSPVMQWVGLVPELPPPRVATPPQPDPSAKSVLVPKISQSSRRLSPSAQDVADKNKALEGWCSIFEAMGGAFLNRRQIEGELTPEKLEVLFALKSPGTMATRASAWNLFFRYAHASGLQPASLDEPAAFAYLQHLKETNAPPSRAGSFLSACHFAYGCAGFANGPSIATSTRCLGAAAMATATQRERLQRDPLQAMWLTLAELEIIKADQGGSVLSEAEGEMLGFLVFCTHGRSRCSDTAKIKVEPTLDETVGPGAAESSFIEAVTIGSAT